MIDHADDIVGLAAINRDARIGRGQHLGDADAYRSDRRKDLLLQENGYLVLRCLAEDLAKELDSVLDGILRSLSSRRTAIVPTHALNVVRGSRP